MLESIQATVASLPVIFRQIIRFIVVFVIVYGSGRLTLEPLVSRLLTIRNIGPTYRLPLLRTVHIITIAVAIGLGLTAAGLGKLLGASATIAAAATLAIGISLQTLFQNTLSGLFIIADPKFEIGHWIQVGEVEGIVEDIGFRMTRVRTFKNQLVTVPNSTLTTTNLTNFTTKQNLRISQEFVIIRGNDLDEATETLLSAASDLDTTANNPQPSVNITDIDPSSAYLEVRFWVRNPNHEKVLAARSEFIRTAEASLSNRGIEISA